MDDRQLLKDPANKAPFLDKKLAKFARYFGSSKRVLEIGAGWGEFLQLLKAQGVACEAVELDARRAAHLRSLGFTVHLAKGQDFLKKAPKGRFDGLFMSNVIEHLPVPAAVEILKQAAARLAPKAKLAITTANPASLHEMSSSFWNDPEHVRPYPLAMLKEILEDAGFHIVLAEADEDTRPQGPLRWLLRKLRSWVVGPFYEASEIYVLAEKR